MFNIEVEGVDECVGKLQDVQNAARELNGETQIPICDIINSSFVSQSTMGKFNDLQQMIDAFSNGIEIDDSFITTHEWSQFINGNTCYAGWEEMLGDATSEYVLRSLGL